ASFPLDGVPLLHDFVMAGSYLVVFVSPVRLDLLPGLLGLKSFGEALAWQPQLGTQILLFDRATLELVARSTADPWYQWHFVNGCEENGELVIEFIRFPDFTTNQNLREIASGKIQTPAAGQLWRVCLDPKTARVRAQEPLSDRTCEYPTIAVADTGQTWCYTYLGVHRAGTVPGSELLGAIAAYNRQNQDLIVAEPGPDCYPSEPIFAPDPRNPTTGWLLTVMYDGRAQQSEVWVYERDRLADGPVCRLGLPAIVPHGFHGTWQPAV
ncbi:MAG: carotenoid oxygenase family protein, partial [Cyanobacteria bacterium J06641_5]